MLALVVRGFSSTFTSRNFVATLTCRCNSVVLTELGAFVHAYNITSLLLLTVLPCLALALLRLFADVYVNTVFFDSSFGGDVLLFRHLFWFFGHPEVYILILPGFGLTSLSFGLLAGVGVYGDAIRVLGVICIGILGLVVWAHHRFTVGRELDSRSYFTVCTRRIAIPTGTKIYNYRFSRGGSSAYNRTNIVLWFVRSVFVVLFTFGGTTGVILGNAMVDIVLHDTYYVVAHFHYTRALGTSLSIVIGTILRFDNHFSV